MIPAYSLQVAVTGDLFAPIGSPKQRLRHAVECAKRSVRRNRKPVDVWLCTDSGHRKLLLAHVSPRYGSAYTGSGLAMLANAEGSA